MKLTQMSSEVFNYVRDNGGRISIDEMVEALGRGSRSIGANVTDLQKKGLVVREHEVDGDKKVAYAVLTDEGKDFVPTEE